MNRNERDSELITLRERQNAQAEMLEKLSELVSTVAVLKAQREINPWVKLAAGAFVAGAVGWFTWVTLNVSNYVSGEKRGERLTGTEAELMIAKAIREDHVAVEHLIDQKLKQIKP